MTTSPPAGPQGVLDRLRDAWDAADAAAFGQLFTEDATYVIWRGDVLAGRPEIQRVHQELFLRSPSKTRIRAVSTRLLDERTAVVLTVGGAGEADVGYDKLQTFVMTKSDDGWRVAAFHNTAMSDQSRHRYQGTDGQL